MKYSVLLAVALFGSTAYALPLAQKKAFMLPQKKQVVAQKPSPMLTPLAPTPQMRAQMETPNPAPRASDSQMTREQAQLILSVFESGENL